MTEWRIPLNELRQHMLDAPDNAYIAVDVCAGPAQIRIEGGQPLDMGKVETPLGMPASWSRELKEKKWDSEKRLVVD